MKSFEMFSKYDIDLVDKLENLYSGEQISEQIHDVCNESETYQKIEEEIYHLLCTDERYSELENFDGLAERDAEDDEHEYWTSCLYNCDSLYMTAIRNVVLKHQHKKFIITSTKFDRLKESEVGLVATANSYSDAIKFVCDMLCIKQDELKMYRRTSDDDIMIERFFRGAVVGWYCRNYVNLIYASDNKVYWCK